MIRKIVIGDDIVRQAIRKKEKEYEKQIERALIRVGLRLQRESQERVPVEYGNLKASAYTRPVGHGAKTEVYVGYTASYAAHVHECVEMKLWGQPRPSKRGRYWDPLGKAHAKFLEIPARTLKGVFLEIFINDLKIKLK